MFKIFLSASRPKTLVAALIPVAIGSALGAEQVNNFSIYLFILTLIAILAIQMATNFFNDLVDGQRNSDTKDRLGPKRFVGAGEINPRIMLYFALGAIFVSISAGFLLLLERGWIILLMGIPSLYCTYGYTAKPLQIAYRGLAEIFVIFFFGVVAVAGSAFVQQNYFSWQAVLLGLQTGLLACSLLAINNYRDIEEDSRSQKKTLAVRLGKNFAKIEIVASLFIPYLLLPLVFHSNEVFRVFSLPNFGFIFSLLLAFFISFKVYKLEPCRELNKFLGLAALHYLIFGINLLLKVLA